MVWELFLKSAKVSLFRNPRKKHCLEFTTVKLFHFSFRLVFYEGFCKVKLFHFCKNAPKPCFLRGFLKSETFSLFLNVCLTLFFTMVFSLFHSPNFPSFTFFVGPDFLDFPQIFHFLLIFLDFFVFSWFFLGVL